MGDLCLRASITQNKRFERQEDKSQVNKRNKHPDHFDKATAGTAITQTRTECSAHFCQLRLKYPGSLNAEINIYFYVRC